MDSSVKQLRAIQLLCTAAVLGYIWLTFNFFRDHTRPHWTMLPPWVILILAAWGAISGFTVQRRLSRPPKTIGNSKVTPLSRWKAGHIARLVSAFGVAGWALVLHFEGAPFIWIAIPYAVSLLLLAIWTPGIAPSASSRF